MLLGAKGKNDPDFANPDADNSTHNARGKKKWTPGVEQMKEEAQRRHLQANPERHFCC